MTLTFQPPSNIPRAIAQQDSAGSFSIAKKADSLAVHKKQVSQVENDNFTVRDGVERLAKHADILGVESAADRHRGESAVGRSLDPQHRHGFWNATTGPTESPGVTDVLALGGENDSYQF